MTSDLAADALRDLLPSAGCVGVPCDYCWALVGASCTWPSTNGITRGPARLSPHSARENRALAVRAWLLRQGIDCNEYADV